MSGPVSIHPDPDHIPEVLRDRAQWVCWRVGRRDGEPTKLPVNPLTGDLASSTDPETWGSFDAAWSRYEDGDVAGIGFVFAEDGPFAGVDLDDCRDPDRPSIDPWAREILDTLDTYAEVSPSGTGVHAILRGELPQGGNRKGDVELYDSARYFTVTGEHLDVTPPTVEARQDALAAIHAEHVGVDKGAVTLDNTQENEATGTSAHLSDDELLEKAKAAENGEKFRRLWNGDTSGYPSHSEADLALCDLLAFWTGGDAARMDRLFRQSGLYRENWDRDDYRDRTIEKALQSRSDFYEPPTEAEPVDPEADPYEAAKADREASTDAAKALAAWDVLQDEIHVLAAEPSGRIYAYRDGVWKPDGKRLLREEAEDLMDVDYSKNVLEELVERVRARRAVDVDDLGTPDRTVAVANGLLDLETRGFEDLKPEHRALAQLPVEYDEHAVAHRWRNFIDEVVEEDRREAVAEYVGYCLLAGELPFARVLLLVGGGSNGKTTFLNVITELLGPENVTGFSLDDLVESEYYLAEMHGAIANIDADVAGSLGYAKKFKKITGGDRKVSARRPYGEPFDYHPTTKHLYAANEVPHTEVDDDAFFRRWLIAEFPTTFTDPELAGPDKDSDLEEKLLDELPGVLNWALDGLDRLLDQGHFTNEGETDEKRQRWQSWGDSVERFIEECVAAEGEEKHRTSDVYERYTAWCDQHGETPESQQTVTAAIKKLNGVRYSKNLRFQGVQNRGFVGLTFTAEAPPPTDAELDAKQTRVTQDAAVRRLRQTVEDLAEDRDAETVPIEEVVEALDGQLGGRDPRHLIQNGLDTGEFYEPDNDGRIAIT